MSSVDGVTRFVEGARPVLIGAKGVVAKVYRLFISCKRTSTNLKEVKDHTRGVYNESKRTGELVKSRDLRTCSITLNQTWMRSCQAFLSATSATVGTLALFGYNVKQPQFHCLHMLSRVSGFLSCIYRTDRGNGVLERWRSEAPVEQQLIFWKEELLDGARKIRAELATSPAVVAKIQGLVDELPAILQGDQVERASKGLAEIRLAFKRELVLRKVDGVLAGSFFSRTLLVFFAPKAAAIATLLSTGETVVGVGKTAYKLEVDRYVKKEKRIDWELLQEKVKAPFWAIKPRVSNLFSLRALA